MMPKAKGTAGQVLDLRPTVYGYLRAATPDEIELAAWQKEIEHFCRERGLRLETVFIDRRISDHQFERPGFAALLQVLQLDNSHGVVLPDLNHLSRYHGAQSELQRLIRRTASKVIVIREQADGA